jgi:hypothetical protein
LNDNSGKNLLKKYKKKFLYKRIEIIKSNILIKENWWNENEIQVLEKVSVEIIFMSVTKKWLNK